MKKVPIKKSKHSSQWANQYDNLQQAIDAAWDLPNGHIHDEGIEGNPRYWVECPDGPEEGEQEHDAADRSLHMRQLIAASGLTTAQVAAALGVSPRTVDCWRAEGRGHRNPPAPMIRLLELIIESGGALIV